MVAAPKSASPSAIDYQGAAHRPRVNRQTAQLLEWQLGEDSRHGGRDGAGAPGLPIYDTISVVVWKALNMAGVDVSRVEGWGRLFDRPDVVREGVTYSGLSHLTQATHNNKRVAG